MRNELSAGMEPRRRMTHLLTSTESVEVTITSPPPPAAAASSEHSAQRKYKKSESSSFRSMKMFRRIRGEPRDKDELQTSEFVESISITPKLTQMTLTHEEDTTSITNQHSLDETNSISRSSSIDQTITSSSFFSSETFFKKTDFEISTWSETIQSTESLSLGFISIMAATVVIHPILFVTGAATAVWAVGMVHAVEKGYKFFSENQIHNMFWDDPEEPILTQNLCTRSTITDTPPRDEKKHFPANNEDVHSTTNYIGAITPVRTPTKHSIQGRSHVKVMDDAIQNHFPSLEHTVVSDIEFPGLNALEFFSVFLADDAPYSFKEFQQTRGDVDVVYGNWDRIRKDSVSFLPEARLQEVSTKLPTSSQRERVCTFKTLTNSYFGPAYANAKKTQRVCKFSTRLVIIESKTELSAIPYADRFYVVERWVVEAVKHDPSSPMIYTSTLSVSVEVIVLRDCTWERQIKSKTISTMTSMIVKWVESATKALDLTIQRKLERMRCFTDKSMISYISDNIGPTQITPLDHSSVTSQVNFPRQSEQILMDMHQRQLKLLEEKIMTGDLEWCSIETKHSEEAGADQAFAEVINPMGNALHFSPEEDDCPLEIAIRPARKKKSKRTLFRWKKK